MDQFRNNLTTFEKTHSWWSDATFMNLQNEVIKSFLDHEITHNEYIQQLAKDGTEEAFCEAITEFSIGSPKLLVIFMACFLNELNRHDSAGLPISHAIVSWYRKNNWKFPMFKHEKIDSNESTILSNHTQPHALE